jgi:hypothetical protein
MARDHDFFVNARRVVEQAIGEHMDGTPLVQPGLRKDPKAVARGRKGGNKGGKARASKLTAQERSEIARKGATARWQKS